MLARGCIVYITYVLVNKLVCSSEIQKLILRICLLTKIGSQCDFVMMRQNSSLPIACRGSLFRPCTMK